jgi:hypothetical protein
MTDIDILTQALNEMVADGQLKMISQFDPTNATDEDLYVKADQ